jgi:hypothetical protein
VIIFSQAHLYADDVQIYVSGDLSDAARVIEKLNADVNNMWHWSQLNSLCLDPQKSQAIVINTKSSPTSNFPPILLNGCIVPFSKKVKIWDCLSTTTLIGKFR